MKVKNFDQYIKHHSKNIYTFLNKVSIATPETINFKYFNYIKNNEDISNNYPIIISSDFSQNISSLNESVNFTYDTSVPQIDSVNSEFKSESFIISEVDSISDIKKLKFPITAYNKNNESFDFKTIGKLRASEKLYTRFKEKVKPRTKFNALLFKSNIISIVEYINNFPLDVDLNRFKYINEINNISNKIYNKYKLDFYNIEILEAIDGSLYLNGINKLLKLNPHQSFKAYEAAYADYYESSLPNWVKQIMINEEVKKYYKNKSYDSMLIKSRHTMDYSKLA